MRASLKAQICFAIVLAAALNVSGKRLVVFGDSISDNGNGTNLLVKARFEELGFQAPLPDYPPAHQYKDARWSNGPTWPDYLVDLLSGYQLYDLAVGGSVVGPSTSTTGDFYPNNLRSNGLGRTTNNVIGLDGQIKKFIQEVDGPISPDDVFVVESGNNNVLGAVTGNVTNIVNFAKNAALDAPVEDALKAVSEALGVNLDTLVAGGAKKIIVWGFVAIEQVPMVQLVNKYVNALDIAFGGGAQDSTVQYGLKVTAAADAAVQGAVNAFKARHANESLTVQYFDFASLQRNFKKQATELGFIDTVNGCVTGMVRSNYATSNDENLGTLVTTFPGASATLLASHDDTLQDKFNLDQYITDTLLGPVIAARPTSTVDFLSHFGDNLYHLQNNSTKSNKLGHILGATLTSLPIGRGGVNPYDFIPTCIANSANHLYHDEVHPTTKQHKLISDALLKQLQGTFFT